HCADHHRNTYDPPLVSPHPHHHRVRGPEIRPEFREDRIDGIRTRDEERRRHEDPEENHESPASPPTERRGPRPAHGSTCSPREYYLRESVVFIVPGSTGSCPRVSAL